MGFRPEVGVGKIEELRAGDYSMVAAEKVRGGWGWPTDSGLRCSVVELTTVHLGRETLCLPVSNARKRHTVYE